jgi:hypothetical protein
MRTTSGRIALLLVLSLAGASREAPAQWVLAAEIGAARFWGASAETGGSDRSFRPYRPTIVGIGLERQARRVGWGIRLRYAGASLALEGDDAVSAVKGALSLYEVAPELSIGLKRLSSGLQFRLCTGPLVEIWELGSETSHVRVGAHAEIGLHVPLSVRVSAGVAANLAVTPSPFNDGDLVAGYEPRTLWRRGVTASLQYRL